MTITERLLKRDYMCKLDYRPCIVGEDKSNPNQQQVCVSSHSSPPGPKQPANSKDMSCIQEAVEDAVDKYRTVNAVTYGRLGYILMVTMAGSWMAVHGMPLIANLQTKDLIPLIRPFEVGCCGTSSMLVHFFYAIENIFSLTWQLSNGLLSDADCFTLWPH